jgi:small-conductance mechanosensitive channel
VRWPVRRLRRRLQAFAAGQVTRAKVGEFTLVSREHAAMFIERILLIVKWVVLGVIAYGWLSFVLSQFPYTRPWGAVLGGRLFALAAGFVHGVIGAVPGLLVAAVIFGGMHWVQKILGSLFDAAESGRVKIVWLYPDTVPATRRIASALLWLFALALAYPYLPGASSAAFQGVTVFAGLMLSLSSSTLIGQLLSGFMLIYSRTFRVGDYVRIGEVEGVVLEIGHFSTKIRTNAREQVAIPNAVVLGQQAKNFSLFAGEHGVLAGAKVTIGYGAPWRQVHALLIQAAERTPGLKKTPPPFVLQTALDDWYVTYQVFAYLEQPETRVFTLAALHENIQDAFNEHGVQIMSPHYVLDPAAPVVVPRDRWHMPPAREKGAAGEGSPS